MQNKTANLRDIVKAYYLCGCSKEYLHKSYVEPRCWCERGKFRFYLSRTVSIRAERSVRRVGNNGTAGYEIYDKEER